MTQPPPAPGYGHGYAPGPNAYPGAGHGNPYPSGPSGYPQPYSPQYPPAPPSPQWNYGNYGPPPGPDPTRYTPWLDRVLAYVIDQIPVVVIFFGGYLVIGVGGVLATQDSSGEPSGAAVVVILLGFFALFAVIIGYWFWNFGYRQGRTGQSIGKKVLKFKVISERTGQPIGFGASVLRQIAHILDGFFYIGYLMPLWDGKRQTIADKMLTTVCVPAPVPAPLVAGPQGGPNPYQYPPR